jgi:uroporphyrinogen-III decarboxylase
MRVGFAQRAKIHHRVDIGGDVAPAALGAEAIERGAQIAIAAFGNGGAGAGHMFGVGDEIEIGLAKAV